MRGSLPAPGADFIRYGGHTSCLALALDGAPAPMLILDAGTGLRAVSQVLGGQPFQGTILLSHLHWDHVIGLPFFAAGDRPDAHTTVLVPEQPDGQDARTVLARMMSPPFYPIEPDELRGSWTFTGIPPGQRRIEAFSVLAREIPHKGGRTFGYRISDGHSTLAYMPDHCPTALGPGEDGLGDYHPAALELADHADLLVHDAQMFPGEPDVGFGHSAAEYAVELARRAHSRAVMLFHHHPDRSDAALDELARQLDQSGYPAVSVAAEGTLLEL
ncbi:MAG TPA: MBL fold metallo-hydrolase [Solirubrobacteraceae bacterium]|nr:MBL fold metallo-hydrolase [Solirubrobacteraceae bacterium]